MARPAVLSLTILCATIVAHPWVGAVEPSPSESAEVSPYVPGELLVTFTAEAADAIEQAQAAGQLPVTGLASLDELVAKFGVTTVEPVFPHLQDPEAIRLKFPERSRRAPPGAELPDLSRTHKVLFDPSRELAEVLIAFLQDAHVESAEPNYVATIQVSPEPAP